LTAVPQERAWLKVISVAMLQFETSSERLIVVITGNLIVPMMTLQISFGVSFS
jgi:hypothetical protein